MFKDIKTILPKSVARAGINGQVDSAKALKIFSKIISNIFDNEIAGKIRPLYVKNSIITVASLSLITVSAIQKKEAKILEKINKNISGKKIKEIRFIV